MKLAPVVLFVYNRPQHTLETLKALMANELAKDSVLYIFSDGPKDDAVDEDMEKIHTVRTIARQQHWFKKVYINESNVNKGLAQSIINGVSQVLIEYDNIIVLEDDLVTGKGFLSYMNTALNLYEKDDRVGCIHGWNYNLNNNGYNASTFFLKGADCWGWATWKRAWKLFNQDGAELIKLIKEYYLEYEFNRRNTHAFINMLQDQVDGKNNSWAIRWHASLLLENKYCLHPVQALVKNIGLDASGTHCNYNNLKQNLTDNIEICKIPVKESEWFFKAYTQYEKSRTEKWSKLKTSLKQLLRR